MLTKAQRRLLVLSSLGGVLEFYDFIIFALLASYISTDFFPTGNVVTSLIATFATFSVGYLVRPIGGLLFGHFGDRLGRKKTFTISVLVMAIATLGIGFIPSYQTIGLAAPLILLGLRILQGLSIGGEIPGALTYISESFEERKGLACGIIMFALLNGIVFGSLITAIFSTILSYHHMQVWGWRIPFFIGGVFGFFSYFSRRTLEESRLFKMIENKTEAVPLLLVLKTKSMNALAGVFVVSLGSCIITLLFLFTPAFIGKVLLIHSKSYIWYNTVSVFVSALLCILFGKISDHVSHKLLLVIICLLAIFFSYPIFAIYIFHFPYFVIALLLSAVIAGLTWGVVPNILTELFPTSIRYSGVALAYNLGFAVFGGLTPFIAMILIRVTGKAIAPIFYFIFTAILALLAVVLIKQRKLHE